MNLVSAGFSEAAQKSYFFPDIQDDVEAIRTHAEHHVHVDFLDVGGGQREDFLPAFFEAQLALGPRQNPFNLARRQDILTLNVYDFKAQVTGGSGSGRRGRGFVVLVPVTSKGSSACR